MRTLGFLSCVLGFGLLACSSKDVTLGKAAETDPDPDPGPNATGSGWSIRDEVPYPRAGHSAVLDEANDRMIVYGGGANDTWALPLSGPEARVWTQLALQGEHPAVHLYGDRLHSDSAVYDPVGQRMLLLVNQVPPATTQSSAVALWELSLSGTAAWRELVTTGPSPGSEVQGGRLALDAENQRVFALGGATDHSGIWSLSLGAVPAWARVADMPASMRGSYFDDATLHFDEARRRIILFGGGSLAGEIWALAPESGEWTQLDEGANGSASYGAATVLDAANDRLVSFGGHVSDGVALYSLSTGSWTFSSTPHSHQASSAVLDAKRGRILYFGGEELGRSDNAVSALALDTLVWSEVVPATRYSNFSLDPRALVYDPQRAGVVAFGNARWPETHLRGLSAWDDWIPLFSVGAVPAVANTSAIYDPVGQAIVAFGRYGAGHASDVVRLASSADATWQKLEVGPGPVQRSRHVTVYDEAQRRLIVHGGWLPSRYGYSDYFGDVWALPLDGAASWVELKPEGLAPSPRAGHVGVYDPQANRLIVYGGSERIARYDLWSLSLEDPPRWTELVASGRGPRELDWAPVAVYDATRHRMIVVDHADDGPAEVFALELGAELVWHRFCSPGITPSQIRGDEGTSSGSIVMVPDGLFLAMSGGALHFDLETSYCDGAAR